MISYCRICPVRSFPFSAERFSKLNTAKDLLSGEIGLDIELRTAKTVIISPMTNPPIMKGILLLDLIDLTLVVFGLLALPDFVKIEYTLIGFSTPFN